MFAFNRLIFLFSIFFFILLIDLIAESKLLSYQSEYKITLAESDEIRLPGKTYVDQANGDLFIDWVNNCENSWVSNQRMITRFINSHGVGTLSEINYSLNEISNASKMDFVLEVKENADLVDRTIGKAERKKNIEVIFPSSEKEKLILPKYVLFPHSFLKDILKNLYGSEKLITRKVYEGTIPDKFFNISVFFTDRIIKEPNDVLIDGVINKFKKIRMSYYQDDSQTPIFEQIVHLNEQGVASFFRYDYPEYSLELRLKKISLVNLNCN